MSPLSQQAAGKKHGWRSGLEERVAAQLDEAGVTYAYEKMVLEYEEPARRRRYTPDFVVLTRSGKQIVVETKGRWLRQDRQKMKLIVATYPGLDLRMVFSNPNQKIDKRSNTTYAAWCEKHLGIPWAARDIPLEWLEE